MCYELTGPPVRWSSIAVRLASCELLPTSLLTINLGPLRQSALQKRTDRYQKMSHYGASSHRLPCFPPQIHTTDYLILRMKNTNNFDVVFYMKVGKCDT